MTVQERVHRLLGPRSVRRQRLHERRAWAASPSGLPWATSASPRGEHPAGQRSVDRARPPCRLPPRRAVAAVPEDRRPLARPRTLGDHRRGVAELVDERDDPPAGRATTKLGFHLCVRFRVWAQPPLQVPESHRNPPESDRIKALWTERCETTANPATMRLPSVAASCDLRAAMPGAPIHSRHRGRAETAWLCHSRCAIRALCAIPCWYRAGYGSDGTLTRERHPIEIREQRQD